MALTLITAPASLAISVAEVKAHLRIDSTDWDALLETYIQAVTKRIDGNTWFGRALVPQVWELVYDQFPCGPIEIPISPLIEVVSITYTNEDGYPTVINALQYEVDTDLQPGWVIPGTDFPWPTPMTVANALRVRFTAGYSAGVPENIKLALKFMVQEAFEPSSDPELAKIAASVVRNLLNEERIFR